MLLHNVRLGFATNSSSTHSIIFLKPNQHVSDSDVEHREFGWDFWTAASTAAKRQYVAIHLYQALVHDVGKDIAEAVCDSWVKDHERAEGKSQYDGPVAGHVDHQSVYVLPSAWNGLGVDREFFKDFQDFFLRPDVVLLGGNDNTEDQHPLAAGDFHLPLPRDGNPGKLVARKDPKGFWTVFDRGSGSKVRFTFANPTANKEVTKSTAPELVDLKITDQCPFGCAFCYQGSTHAGKHADHNVISQLAYTLGQMHVFEVALGGGEPTLHPKFVEILTSFKHYGVIPNFTTKSLAWLRDPAVWPKIIESIGGFAFSVEKAEDVKKLATLLDLNGIDTNKASVQHVMGTGNLYDLEQIIRTCAEHNLRITLLGYKLTGRGESFKPQDYKGWLDVVKKIQADKVYFTLGIDTALAKQSGASLAKAKIPTRLYETEEGKFSMYFDAVDMKMGPSSYCDDVVMKRVNDKSGFNDKAILDAFATWGKTSWERILDEKV